MNLKDFLNNVKVRIDRENEPQKEVIDKLVNIENLKEKEAMKNPNQIFEEISKPSEGALIEPHRWLDNEKDSPSEKCPKNLIIKGVKISIFDILGEYDPQNKEIILYEKNIKKSSNNLKDNLLKIYQWLGKHPLSSDTFHFPLDYFFAWFALKESLTFNEFTRNLIRRWSGLFGKMGPTDKHKQELLTFEENEIFKILKDLVLMHEAGHALHHALLGDDKFKKCKDYTKEGLADLNALFAYEDVKHKVIFFSFTSFSYTTWFYFYRKAYKKWLQNNKDLWKNKIEFLKDIWETFKNYES